MTEERDIRINRQRKMEEWLDSSEGYTNSFRRDNSAVELHEKYEGIDKSKLENLSHEASVCGRVMFKRVMGKASFISIQDISGQIQCYLTKEKLGEQKYANTLSLLDVGDIVGVEGTVMRTNKGELTISASDFFLLNKTLQPLPEKYHGLVDQEVKYRQRYLDLIMSSETRTRFRARSDLIQKIRTFFVDRGYLEVETPMMHPIPGGATARPFSTFHNALDRELYLRVAPELYLKKLVVGGFERVFELNRNFRNEGLSTRHNPEFTMLECYQAYSDYRDLIEMTDQLLSELVHSVSGSSKIVYQDREYDFSKGAQQITMSESICSHTAIEENRINDEDYLRHVLGDIGVRCEEAWGIGKLQLELFEAQVEDKLEDPTYVTEYPAEVSPLARRKDGNPEVTDRFELFIGGREYANGFSELNDPVDQSERFQRQSELKESGDSEAMHFDHDYITALEYGLPPTAGEGIGIDRLVMFLTNAPSIRDVLLFPQLRNSS